MRVDLVATDKVDVEDIIREQIYLSLPMKSLCRETCPGLCPVCGANLSDHKCGCQRETGHPGFAALGKFESKGKQK
jgi:uncharacterized protein